MSLEHERKFTIRRLAPSEIKNLDDMQQFAPVGFDTIWPKHSTWLKRCSRELESGKRIALGVFAIWSSKEKQRDGMAKKGRSDGMAAATMKNGLVASIILRKEGVTSIVEAKNLLVRQFEKGETPPATRSQLAKFLLDGVDGFCGRRGFKAVEMECPASFREEIGWLLNSGYHILSTRSSRYQTLGGAFYNLSKSISPVYSGDPFDYSSMVHWLFNEKLSWPLDEQPIRYEFNKGSPDFCMLYKFKIPTFSSDLLIKGHCLVDQNYGTEEELQAAIDDLSSRRSDLHLMLSFRETPSKIKDRCDLKKVRLLDRNVLVGLLGNKNSLSSCPFDEEHLGGLILDVGGSYIDEVRKKSIEGRPFAFFLTSGIGWGLSIYDYEGSDGGEESQNKQNGYIALLCSTVHTDDEKYFTPALCGYATIRIAYLRQQNIAFSQVPRDMRLWNEQVYGYYVNEFSVNFSEFQHVTVLEIDPPKMLVTPVKLNQIPNLDLPNDLLDRFLNEGISATYINRNLVRVAVQYIDSNPIIGGKSSALEAAADGRSVIRRIRTTMIVLVDVLQKCTDLSGKAINDIEFIEISGQMKRDVEEDDEQLKNKLQEPLLEFKPIKLDITIHGEIEDRLFKLLSSINTYSRTIDEKLQNHQNSNIQLYNLLESANEFLVFIIATGILAEDLKTILLNVSKARKAILHRDLSGIPPWSPTIDTRIRLVIENFADDTGIIQAIAADAGLMGAFEVNHHKNKSENAFQLVDAARKKAGGTVALVKSVLMHFKKLSVPDLSGIIEAAASRDMDLREQ